MTLRHARNSVEDGFAVFVRPSAKNFQNVFLLCGDCSIFSWSNIEQEVATHTDTVGKNRNDLIRSFIIQISRLISPVIVSGHAQFPPPKMGSSNGKILLGCIIV